MDASKGYLPWLLAVDRELRIVGITFGDAAVEVMKTINCASREFLDPGPYQAA
jgi:hypothetical protein